MSSPPTLPPAAGIGLKPEHYAPALGQETGAASPNWVEIHPQNYFAAGGPAHRWLGAFCAAMPVSFHSVGLSIGSASGVNAGELAQLKALADRYQPAMISDHLSWSETGDERFPDLLPMPCTIEALDHCAREVGRVQEALGRAILIENPSRMLAFAQDDMHEADFLTALCARSGCGLLLDINNVDVSATNLGFDASAWLDAINPALVGEIHLAGHAVEHHASGPLLIDDHGSPVSEGCWALYAGFIARAGPIPTLIERDTNIPSYGDLRAEADRADAVLEAERMRHVHAA